MQSATFSLLDNVELYGGFLGQAHPSGGEGSRSARNPEQNETILSGNIGDPNDPDDNSDRVLYASEVSSAVLNGFTIRDGRGGNTDGGGGLFSILSTLRVVRCTFRENSAASGGAVRMLGYELLPHPSSQTVHSLETLPWTRAAESARSMLATLL